MEVTTFININNWRFGILFVGLMLVAKNGCATGEQVASELLNEATKRAVLLSSQITD